MHKKPRLALQVFVPAVTLILAGMAAMPALDSQTGSHLSSNFQKVKLVGVETEWIFNELTEEQIRSFMEALYEEYEKNMTEGRQTIDPNAVLVIGKNVTVTAGEFMEYKYKTTAIRHFNEVLWQHTAAAPSPEPTHDATTNAIPGNKDLLLQYLRPYVLAEHAKEIGLQVERKELDDYVAWARQAMFESSNTAVVPSAVMLEFILKLNGWTEEEYWNMPIVRDRYEREVLRQKLEQHWRETGKAFTDSDVERIDQSLLDKAMKQFDVNWALLYKIP